MDLIQPTIMQHMIDTGIANGDNAYVLKMFVWMIMSAVLGLVGGLGCSIYSSKAAINFASDVREKLYEKMMTYSAKERDAFTTGKLITILTSDVESVQRAFMMTLRIFVRGPLLFIGAVVIVFVTARELFFNFTCDCADFDCGDVFFLQNIRACYIAKCKRPLMVLIPSFKRIWRGYAW